MVSPYDFEYVLGEMSPGKSGYERERYIQDIISLRKSHDPDIYEKIIVGNKRMSLMISIATVLLVIIYIYAIYAGDHAEPKIMVYTSAAVITLLIASGATL